MPGMGKSRRRNGDEQKGQKRAHKYLHLGTRRPVAFVMFDGPGLGHHRTAGLLAPGTSHSTFPVANQWHAE